MSDFTTYVKNRNYPAGRGTGVDGSARSRLAEADRTEAQRLAFELQGPRLVKRRHIDWVEHQIRWRWLLDSYEAGDRYRSAVYGPDRRGLPCRNLFRHRREYPDPQLYPNVEQGFATSLSMGETTGDQVGMGVWPGMVGADPGATAMDDDYELRRARTPVPEFVSEAVSIHLGKVYDQEIGRDGPDFLEEWWLDVDGKGTSADEYMRETIAPLLMTLGCLDVILDRPMAPPGETIATRADELRLGLDKCVIAYILPENLVWWRTDQAGRYVQCLVREYADPADRNDTDDEGQPIDPFAEGESGQNWRTSYVRWRHWTETESVLFNFAGDEVLERIPHPYGRVPIVRLIDLKKHRSPNIGKSRYEAIAEYQREFYNRDSELILSDTLQAHPYLSGAEDFCKSDNTLSVGPGYILPMKKNPETGAYQGWEFVSPPKDPAASLRINKADLVELKDRHACLDKPAGAVAGTVGQSGISKQLDAHTGHKQLTDIARSLAKAERTLAEYAWLVLRLAPPSPADRAAVKVVYPSRFDLQSAADLTDGMGKLQLVVKAAGAVPTVEAMGVRAIVRQLLLGLTDAEYKALDDEVNLAIKAKALPSAGTSSTSDALEGSGTALDAAQADPTGLSGSTMVSTPSFTA